MSEIDRIVPGAAIPPRPQRQPDQDAPRRPRDEQREPKGNDDEDGDEEGIDVFA